MRTAAGMTELLMDGRFAPALQDISLQLIIQQLSILSSSSSPCLCPPASSPSVPFILSSASFIHFIFFKSSLSHPDFPKWDSNWQLSDHCLSLSVNIAFPTFYISSSFSLSPLYVTFLLFIFCISVSTRFTNRLPLSSFVLTSLQETKSCSTSASLPFTVSLSLSLSQLLIYSKHQTPLTFFFKNSYNMHLETCKTSNFFLHVLLAFFFLSQLFIKIMMQS